jgi:hypothetical protein
MGSLIRLIIQGFIKYALPVAAGIGAGAVMDKVAADKLPAYPEGGILPALTGDSSGKTSIPKILYILLAVTVGSVVITFIIRKLKIRI